MLAIIRRRLIKGAQKAVVAAAVAASVALVARYPFLADMLSEGNVTTVTNGLFELLFISGSGVLGYVLTWWKRNRE